MYFQELNDQVSESLQGGRRTKIEFGDFGKITLRGDLIVKGDNAVGVLQGIYYA